MFSRDIDIKTLLREIKRNSSKWINEEKELRTHFQWQNGYGAFSISPAHVDPLRHYIKTQMEHRRKETFQDEFRRLLRIYGVQWDERYVWD